MLSDYFAVYDDYHYLSDVILDVINLSVLVALDNLPNYNVYHQNSCTHRRH